VIFIVINASRIFVERVVEMLLLSKTLDLGADQAYYCMFTYIIDTAKTKATPNIYRLRGLSAGSQRSSDSPHRLPNCWTP
ncbi:MAG TPA: hypothetical protein DCG57_06000, partial [Candidatus Riflebacteria bacterium]|nr:hypothetical protein [Candidatus Riflebacteria bacterium]